MSHEQWVFWLELVRRAWFLVTAIFLVRQMYKRSVEGTLNLYGQIVERDRNPGVFWSLTVACVVAVILLLMACVR